MGHDIEIFNVYFYQGKVYRGEDVDEHYISFNWSEFSKIWHVTTHLDGFNGRKVANEAKKAIDKIKQMGISIGIPDLNNSNWSYGVHETNIPCPIFGFKTEKLPKKTRLGIFAYHLQRIFEKAIKNRKCYFKLCDYAPNEKHLEREIIVNGKKENYCDLKDAPEELNLEPKLSGCEQTVTYFNHPSKGMMKIDNFKDCMEIYGILKLRCEDELAEYWYKLAFEMKDSPIKQ